MLRRTLTPEIMDDPEIDGERHSHALRGLSKINSVSFAAIPVVRAIRNLIEPGPVHVLDIATGSGDVAHAVSKSLSRTGYSCSFTLTDISQRALDKAKLRFEGRTAETVTLDATQDTLPAADIVMCSLFMHHLKDDQAAALFQFKAPDKLGHEQV